jgi:hypothetical protein
MPWKCVRGDIVWSYKEVYFKEETKIIGYSRWKIMIEERQNGLYFLGGIYRS